MTGPALPPRNEEQLRNAARSGLLVESHTLTLKRELTGGDSGNHEIAKDIAAFSLDGGAIIIGVDPDTDPPSLHPVELAGLAERIDHVAATEVDEPVSVIATPIASATEASRGVLVVEIPVSARPPHMADGRYYGRGDTTNRILMNAEVFALHERVIKQHKDIAVEARENLDRLIEQNGTSAVMVLLANPLTATEDFLMPLSASSGWREEVVNLLHGASVADHQQFVPSLREPAKVVRRPWGVAATTWAEGRRFQGKPDQAEVTIYETGALAVVSGGLITYSTTNGGLSGPQVRDQVIVGQTDLIVRLAAMVSDYGFHGSWRFGIAVGGLNGATSYTLSHGDNFDARLPRYTKNTYDQAATAAFAELTESPQLVVRLLVGPLLRSLGSDSNWPWLLE